MWFVGYTGVHKATMTIRSHFYVQIVITEPKFRKGWESLPRLFVKKDLTRVWQFLTHLCIGFGLGNFFVL